MLNFTNRVKKLFSAVLLLTFICSIFLSTNAFAVDLTKDKTVYTIATAHLDTQWNWNVKTSINSYIPKTLDNNFTLFQKYPDYKFNFEGAFRYSLAKEYYPDKYQQLKDYIAQGRWNVTGSSWDAGDVNVPSSEAVMRNILYGNEYFKKEFGKVSSDIFLPDCFGFGYALPSIAAHMGLIGFSTQKLSWGSAYGIPFDIGKWFGVDGSYLISALNPGSYSSSITKSVSTDTTWVNRVNDNGSKYGLYAAYKYYGTGDTGGSPSDGSVNIVQQDINKGPDPTTGVQVLSAPADQLYKDIIAQNLQDNLPSYDGELVMSTHGVGSYTSRTISKRWNRQNELLADATERASVIADWLKGAPYPKEQLDTAWKRFLWHQFHDDITGTSLPSAYMISWNDYILSLNQFSQELTNGVGAIAKAMDTNVSGIPVVVYNPISKQRKDIVEAKVTFPAGVPEAVRVYDPNGNEVPSQLGAVDGKTATVLFLSDMPSVGYKVYDIKASDTPCEISTGLSVTDSTLENNYYKVTIDSNGDISSIFDKVNNKELLSAPSKLELLNDNSTSWPSWEILYNDDIASPREYVTGPADVEIVENGPARVALKVTRTTAGSTFTQIIRLTAGDDAQRIDVDNNVNWNTKATNLKVAFPLTVSNPKATYDLGLGNIQRGNDTQNLYEVVGQQWADLTDTTGSYGVSILNDCKYGWDKPDDNTLRLTLIHTPKGAYGNNKQDTQDFGENRFLYSIYGHAGDYVNGQTVTQAERVNQPLKAFQTNTHSGNLGKAVSFLNISDPNVTVKAVKLAEDGNGYIVRVQETSGKPINGVLMSIGNGILAAEEDNGSEEYKAPAQVQDGKLIFDIKKFEPKTFRMTLSEPTETVNAPSSTAIALPYNKDVVSFDNNRQDGSIDFQGNTIPAELFSDTVTSGGIQFTLGPKDDGSNNAMVAQGQNITIPDGYKQVYLLAASTAGDKLATFKVNGNPVDIKIQDYKQNIGQWEIKAINTCSYIKRDPVAWVATHTHTPAANSAYDFIYLFKYRIDLPNGENTITLPEDNNILVFAMTASNNDNDNTVSISKLYDEKDANGLATLTVINGNGSGLYLPDSIVPISAQVPTGYVFREWTGAEVADPSSPNTTIKVPKEGVTVTAVLMKLGPNLALGKAVTASGQTNDNEAPRFAVDGSTGTKWCQTGKTDKWLVVDLGQEYNINRWIVKHAGAGGESTSWNTGNFRLDVSLDGNNWNTVDTVTNNILSVTNRVINPVAARYVRLYITKATTASSTDTAARIYEFEVYDSPEAVAHNLTVEGGSGSGTYEEGTLVPIAAMIPTGYLFKEWVSDTAQIGNPTSPKTYVRIPSGDAKVTAVLINLGTDLALNKPATASAYVNANEAPGKAVDGDMKTKWCSNTPGYNWLIVDLGREYEINKYVVRHSGAGGETQYPNTPNFRLDVSSDNTNWNTVDTVTGNTDDITARDIQSVKARYVRFYVLDPATTDVNTHPRIYSFEVYGPNQLGIVNLTCDKTELKDKNETAKLALSGQMTDGSEADLTQAIVKYISSDESVAKVDENGIVTPVNTGTAEISANITLGDITIQTNVITITVTIEGVKSSDAKLSSIKIDGNDLEGFDPNITSYTVILPAGAAVPNVTATTHDVNANYEVSNPDSIPGITRIVVTAEDGTQNTYAINFITNVIVDLTPYYNQDGFSFDTNMTDGNYDLPGPDDGEGAVYDAGQVKLDPIFEGVGYKYGPFEDGKNNAIYGAGQTIAIPQGKYSSVRFLGSGTQGDQTGNFTINYSDNTTDSVTITQGDWVVTSVPQKVAQVMDSRHFIGGDGEDHQKTYIYAYYIDTDVAKAVTGITMPNNKNMHILALSAVPAIQVKSNNANLSEIKIDGNDLKDFDPNTTSYTVILPPGTNVVPQIAVATEDPKAEVIINQANGLPGTTKIIVTAEDGTVKIYEVNFIVETKLIEVTITADNTTIERTKTVKVTLSGKMSDGEEAVLTNAKVEYFSNDPSIASIDENGIITAKKVGTTQVFATVELGGVKVISNLLTVNVIKAEAGSIQFKVETAKDITEIGETNTVIISAIGANDLYGFDLKLKYDPELFSFEGATVDNDFAKGTIPYLDVTDDNGNVQIVSTLLGNETGVSGDIKLVNLTFKSKSIQGNSFITLARDSEVSDSNSILYTIEDDIVSAIPVADSDVTGEGLSIGSVTMVAKAFNLKQGEAGYDISLDMNKDGIIDIVDIAYIVNRLYFVQKKDATLSSIKIDGKDLEGFDKDTLEYTVKIAVDVKVAPKVTAVANSSLAKVEVTQADTIPGTAVIRVTAKNGTERIYMINFAYEETLPQIEEPVQNQNEQPAEETIPVDAK